MPPREARPLPNLASIGKVAEFTGLRAPFLGPFPTRHPSLFLLIASVPRPTIYREQRTLIVSSNGPHLKWLGFTVNGRATL